MIAVHLGQYLTSLVVVALCSDAPHALVGGWSTRPHEVTCTACLDRIRERALGALCPACHGKRFTRKPVVAVATYWTCPTCKGTGQMEPRGNGT